AGQLLIKDQDVFGLGERKLAGFRNQEIGFVFQFHHLLPEFDAVDNVCMPAFIAGTQADQARTRAEELLDYLGLGDRLGHKPTELSGGEQQRVAVARALMNNPAIVFADEPSGNLDTASSESLHELILNLRKDFDQTFVIVTHNMDLAAMSDRRLEMIDGRLASTQESLT
ncbi:MAG: ABC transporter ATP-binding protein, partial [Bacteroidota bacterium]